MNKSNWLSNGFVEWTRDDLAYLSIVFSWKLQEAYQRAIWYRSQGYKVIAGGPAVMANPNYLSKVAKIEESYPDAIVEHNSKATFTSRGCIRKCEFCIVPKIEGELIELKDWPIRPIICDNNILACSKSHFDSVIDKLKSLKQIDFNQGLDARILTKYQAERLKELDLRKIRLAWDHSKLEASFMRAFEILRKAGFSKRRISVYVLIGYRDSPEDALYRLETIKSMGIRPFPMRYQPIDVKKKNKHVSKNWTEFELRRFSRYWSRLRFLEHIPFQEYQGNLSEIASQGSQ